MEGPSWEGDSPRARPLDPDEAMAESGCIACERDRASWDWMKALDGVSRGQHDAFEASRGGEDALDLLDDLLVPFWKLHKLGRLCDSARRALLTLLLLWLLLLTLTEPTRRASAKERGRCGRSWLTAPKERGPGGLGRRCSCTKTAEGGRCRACSWCLGGRAEEGRRLLLRLRGRAGRGTKAEAARAWCWRGGSLLPEEGRGWRLRGRRRGVAE